LVPANYHDLLKKMSLEDEEIRERIEAGFDPKSFREVLHLKHSL
jgi:hypothetical protein